jgi:hypothetical protein
LFEFFLNAQLSERQGGDARVGQHDVEASEVFHSGIDSGLDGVKVAHVGDGSEHLATGLLDEIDCLVQLFVRCHRVVVRGDVTADVDADDVRALAGESHRVAAALTSGHPGDEGDTSFK